MPVNRITAILNGQRVVTSNTVPRVVRYFRTTLKFWLNLEKTWELRLQEIATSCRNAAHVQPQKTIMAIARRRTNAHS